MTPCLLRGDAGDEISQRISDQNAVSGEAGQGLGKCDEDLVCKTPHQLIEFAWSGILFMDIYAGLAQPGFEQKRCGQD